MSILHPRPFVASTRLSTVSAGLAIADASDLGLPPGFAFGRVYDDACDVGLTLVTTLGREITYVVEREERRDGDLLYWELRPASNNHRALPTIQIYND